MRKALGVLAVAGVVVLAAQPAHADAMSDWFARVGAALKADFACTAQSFRDGGVTLPRSFGVKGALNPGEYRDALSGCAFAGRPYGPQF